jgi:murein DD-endopeptidase MepM/ murein hydrolase activator NlpD
VTTAAGVAAAALLAVAAVGAATPAAKSTAAPAVRSTAAPAVRSTAAPAVRRSAGPAARRSVTPAPTAAEPTPVVREADLRDLRARALAFPVPSIRWEDTPDTYTDRRGAAPHEALDIPAPRGAPAVAVDDGVVAKLYRSVPGGLTIYLFDRGRRFAYYYAHLDRYEPGLHEGQIVARGDVLGYVGSTGNASPDGPHLHFTIYKLDPSGRWWRGTALNPHPLLRPSTPDGAR